MQLLLSVQGAVSTPGMVFAAVISKQQDQGVTQLRQEHSAYAVSSLRLQNFLILSFMFYLGDYSDQTIALWNTYTYELMWSTCISEPVHDMAFSPFSHRELACVGKGTVMFWLLEQQGADVYLKVNLSFTFFYNS